MHETIVQNSQLLPGLRCGADESIALRGEKVDFMFRDLPREENDSAWGFQDTEEESCTPSNPFRKNVLLDSILKNNPDILPHLNAPYFSAFTRNKEGILTRDLKIEKDYDDERNEYEEGLQLIPIITDAFCDVQLEDGTSFHQAKALDDYADTDAARLLDTDNHWTEVDLTKIRLISVMSFMDAKGFRYYLPAFMIFELKYPLLGNNFGLDSHLQGWDVDKSSDRFKILNQAQCVAVLKFLEFKVKYSDIFYGDALRSYWHQFKN